MHWNWLNLAFLRSFAGPFLAFGLALVLWTPSSSAKFYSHLEGDADFIGWLKFYEEAEAKVRKALPENADHYDVLYGVLAEPYGDQLHQPNPISEGHEAAYHKLIVRLLNEEEAPKAILRVLFQNFEPVSTLASLKERSFLLMEEDVRIFVHIIEAYHHVWMPRDLDKFLKLATEIADEELDQDVRQAFRKALVASGQPEALRLSKKFATIPQRLLNCTRALVGLKPL